MTEPPQPTTLVCPKCGHQRFDSNEPASITFHGIRVWFADTEPELVLDYDAVWDTRRGDAEFADELTCCGCGQSLRSADLVLIGQADLTWTPPERAPEPTALDRIIAECGRRALPTSAFLPDDWSRTIATLRRLQAEGWAP